MKKRTIRALCLAAALACGSAFAPAARSSEQAPLRRAGATPLPGYTGDFDHSAVDLPGNRLFVAAEDHGTVEVFNLRTGARMTTITGTETPHSILYMPDINRLLVTDTGKQGPKIFDATSYKLVGTVKLTGPTKQDGLGGVFADPFSVSREVGAVFGEMRVSIFGSSYNLPGLHALDFIAAGRGEVYSGAGRSFVPKFGARWQPFDRDLTIRSSYSRSFTAPTLFAEADRPTPALSAAA